MVGLDIIYSAHICTAAYKQTPDLAMLDSLSPAQTTNQSVIRVLASRKLSSMNSTKVQNPRRKMQVALLAEPNTPLVSSVFIASELTWLCQGPDFRYNIYISISTGAAFYRNVIHNSKYA